MKGQVFVGEKQLVDSIDIDCELGAEGMRPPMVGFSAKLPWGSSYQVGQVFRASYELGSKKFSHDVIVKRVVGDLVEFEAQ